MELLGGEQVEIPAERHGQRRWGSLASVPTLPDPCLFHLLFLKLSTSIVNRLSSSIRERVQEERNNGSDNNDVEFRSRSEGC